MRRNRRAGHAEALELPVVEATDDGLLADLADLGGFAGREHGLHAFVHPLLARPARTSEVRAGRFDRAGADRNQSLIASCPSLSTTRHRQSRAAAHGVVKVVGSSAPWRLRKSEQDRGHCRPSR